MWPYSTFHVGKSIHGASGKLLSAYALVKKVPTIWRKSKNLWFPAPPPPPEKKSSTFSSKNISQNHHYRLNLNSHKHRYIMGIPYQTIVSCHPCGDWNRWWGIDLNYRLIRLNLKRGSNFPGRPTDYAKNCMYNIDTKHGYISSQNPPFPRPILSGIWLLVVGV